MPELPILLFIGLLVAGMVLLLRREYRVPRDRPTLDVQNHEGDR
jgi:uncharacterized membrane protein